MPRKNYIQILAVAGIALILILVVAVRLGRRDGADPAELADTTSGVAFLQSLEAKDAQPVVDRLKAIRRQHLIDLRDERMRQLESGEISVWTLFEDYVLLGDSRAVGFWFYDFLPENRVLADAGDKISDLEAHIPDIVAMSPANLFFCYGINDVGIGLWPTPESYVEDFSRIIGEIQAQLPEVNIYISSILPATDPAFEQNSAWYDIPQYNVAVRAMCDGIDRCYFVDNDRLAEEYSYMYEVDGIHLTRDFYPHWAANMITEVYSSQLDWGEDGAPAATPSPAPSAAPEGDTDTQVEEDPWAADAY